MDVLKNEQYKSYDRLSRYSAFPIYYNTLDDKYESSTVSYLSSDTQHVLYKVKEGDTYDKISLQHYNNPTYFWIICNYNRVLDSFEKPEPGSVLKIPIMSNIEFYL